MGSRFRLHAGSRPRFSARLSGARSAQLRKILVGGGARGTIGAPRRLRRVQPALRPRHLVRAENRRQCRVDSLLNAPAGEMAMRVASSVERGKSRLWTERSVFVGSGFAPSSRLRTTLAGGRRLIRNALQRRGFVGKPRGNPLLLCGRKRSAELRPFWHAARHEVGGLERKHRRLPPLGKQRSEERRVGK